MTKLIDSQEFIAKKDFFLIRVNREKCLDRTEIFGNSNPLLLEIGSGKGEFISEYPLLHPECNFIGFEVRQKRVDITLRKLDPAKHGNVRVATFMIDRDIERIIPAGSVEGVFIQHPDPWPKRKHFKRRLFQQEFLDALAKIIRPGGFIQVATDHAEYAQWIWKEFLKRQDFSSRHEDGISSEPVLEGHVITFYEREQRRLGFEPRHMLFERR